MARLPLPDIEILRQRFRYEPATGRLLCAIRKDEGAARRTRDRERAISWNANVFGKPVGCLDKTRGYLIVGIGRQNYFAHRIIWKLVHGIDPVGDIDHINGVRTDNRLANLRIASPALNARNKRTTVRSKTGVRGVYKYGERFLAMVKEQGAFKRLGSFLTLEEAAAARMKHDAANGFTARHLAS